jgi:hypothetical protein
MSYARQMLDTYPGNLNADAAVLAATIDALSDCGQACCADADAARNLAEMVKCIRLCLDCTDVCTATLGVVSRHTDYDPTITRPLLETCVATCKAAATNARATPALQALPGLRACLPPLRPSLPGTAGRP